MKDGEIKILENYKNSIILADCMDIMKDMPDDYVDLAIVDPEYRDNNQPTKQMRAKHGDMKKWAGKPDQKYFDELFRASKNQIIWGGNYFSYIWKLNDNFIFWDKHNPVKNYSDGELAWTSFSKVNKKYSFRYYGNHEGNTSGQPKIHATQKPIALYRWLLQNYAKPGQLILDTHSGSGSLACACHLEKFDFIAIEKDVDYHRDSVSRLDELRSQGVLF